MKYEIGKRIKYFREKEKISQKDLANKLNISNARLSNWEKGINRPDADFIADICTSLKITADELLGIDVNSKQINVSKNELKHLNNYRKLSDSNKKDVDDFMDFRLHKEQQDYNRKQYLKVARGKGEELVSDEDIDKMIENSTEVKGDDDLV